MKQQENEYLILFGLRLKEIRKSKKMSYRKLAQHCDIDYSDISKIEKGAVNIRLTTVTELAKGLGIHPKKLLDFEFDFEE